MNKKYEIKYLEVFYKDLSSIINYIKYELGNEDAARNLLNKIVQEISKRSYNPEAYEKYLSIRKRKDTYYRIYVKNYTIFYVVKDNTMEVRRIIYSKRNLKNMI